MNVFEAALTDATDAVLRFGDTTNAALSNLADGWLDELEELRRASATPRAPGWRPPVPEAGPERQVRPRGPARPRGAPYRRVTAVVRHRSRQVAYRSRRVVWCS